MNDYSWIKVKRYKMDKSKTWEERYKELEAHHIEETNFLIKEIETLRFKIDTLTSGIEELERYIGNY